MDHSSDEFDKADQLVREQFDRATLWKIAEWTGPVSLNHWDVETGRFQTGHFDAAGEWVASVFSVRGHSSLRAVQRLSCLSMMSVGMASYHELIVGENATRSERVLSVGPDAVTFGAWINHDGSLWLAADYNDSALVVRLGNDAYEIKTLAPVVDIEPLLSERRRHVELLGLM